MAALLMIGGCASGAASSASSPSTTGSCATGYSPASLRKRSFAFDGVVTQVRAAQDRHLPAGHQGVTEAVFKVNKWFTGHGGQAVTVTVQRHVSPGDRLLVAGEPRWGGHPLDDPIAWECGFTTPYYPDAAAQWKAAFAK